MGTRNDETNSSAKVRMSRAGTVLAHAGSIPALGTYPDVVAAACSGRMAVSGDDCTQATSIGRRSSREDEVLLTSEP